MRWDITSRITWTALSKPWGSVPRRSSEKTPRKKGPDDETQTPKMQLLRLFQAVPDSCTETQTETTLSLLLRWLGDWPSSWFLILPRGCLRPVGRILFLPRRDVRPSPFLLLLHRHLKPPPPEFLIVSIQQSKLFHH